MDLVVLLPIDKHQIDAELADRSAHREAENCVRDAQLDHRIADFVDASIVELDSKRFPDRRARTDPALRRCVAVLIENRNVDTCVRRRLEVTCLKVRAVVGTVAARVRGAACERARH